MSDKWISCDDRLPPTGSTYLTWGGHSIPVALYLDGDGWWEESDGDNIVGVTHWMPLPKSPKDK